MSPSIGTFEAEITVTEGVSRNPIGRADLLAADFSVLKRSFPCRRRHLEVATFVKAVMNGRRSVRMFF
jgi:hypothetical protein